jgi:hypothetical protein
MPFDQTDMDSAVRAVGQALSLSQRQRTEMGARGREWILNGHTYLHRAYRILDLPLPANIRDLVLSISPVEPERAPMPVRGL